MEQEQVENLNQNLYLNTPSQHPDQSEYIEYTISFDEETATKIEDFCNVFYLEKSDFVAKSVGNYFYWIEADIDELKFELFTQYLDLSKIIGNLSKKKVPPEQMKCRKIPVKVHPRVSSTIEHICEKIHWKPEQLIERETRIKISDNIKDIKNGDFEFLSEYIDFSEILDDISYLRENGLI